MHSKILAITIILQLIIIAILGLRIYNQQHSDHISVNVIPESSLLFPKNGEFKYYYEPKPNSTQYLDPQWIKDLGYPAGTVVRYKINSDGLNQIPNYTVQKPKGIYRIITLGDSFTYGQNVNTENNYPSQLEKKLNEDLKCKNISSFQVLNLGMEGFDISYPIERYKLKGEKYNPDLILWLMLSADLTRVDEMLIPKSKKYDQQLQDSGEASKAAQQGIFYQGWEHAQEDIITQLGGLNNIFQLQKKYFSQLNNYYNGPLLIFNFPTQPDFESVLNDLKNSRKNTYLYLNLTDIYSNHQYYLKDGHPSAQGYTAIVNDLYNYLTENNIIPCQKP